MGRRCTGVVGARCGRRPAGDIEASLPKYGSVDAHSVDGNNRTGRRRIAAPLSIIGDLLTVGRRELDLSQPETIIAALDRLQLDLIVNPAAYTAVDLAEDEPHLAFSHARRRCSRSHRSLAASHEVPYPFFDRLSIRWIWATRHGAKTRWPGTAVGLVKASSLPEEEGDPRCRRPPSHRTDIAHGSMPRRDATSCCTRIIALGARAP